MPSFFSYGLVLTTFFDTVGRREMIVGTYAVAGVLLLVTAILLSIDAFTAWTQTIAWMAVFFFASAAVSSAYLTASEIFPLEARALAPAAPHRRNPSPTRRKH